MLIYTLEIMTTKMERRHQMSSSPTVMTPISTTKTNHVSTVLLCDIPIVSLYIDGQERLCLAQISNTLLKQFSYNEIHNRRVALGITCVQCTPVQLEILRRAGAMPVSSRRCGMITRREAERLCKSFLGDNAPPRLPDDFAFSVYHKCAWGCCGSFLPSRYNSSRAKCIKCNYCGLFFSPNKFIFHSHRISASEKYIQPDAANFNSWRRHMMLSGHPPEATIHAWEDVKAMFNGGTRKRSVSLSPLSTSGVTGRATATHSHSKLGSNTATPNIIASRLMEEKYCETRESPKYPKENENIGAVTAAAVVGVTAVAAAVGAVAQQMPLNPFNIHSAAAALPTSSHSCSTTSGAATSNEISIIPFSRSFVDYMWHAQAVQSTTQLQLHQKCNGRNTELFSLPNCNLPWLENSNGVGSNEALIFGATYASAQLPSQMRVDHSFKQMSYPSLQSDIRPSSASAAVVASASKIAGIKIFQEPNSNLPQFLKSSAFKPVIQYQQQLKQDHQQAVANTSASSILMAATATATATGTATLLSTPANSTVAVSTAAESFHSSHSPISSSSSLALPKAAVQQAASKISNTPSSLIGLLPPPSSPLLSTVTESLKTSKSAILAASKELPSNNTEEKLYLGSPEKITRVKTCPHSPTANITRDSPFSEKDEETTDEELVDIETTEEDQQVMQSYKNNTDELEEQKSPMIYQKSFSPFSQLCQRKYERCDSVEEINVDDDDDSCSIDALAVNGEIPHVMKVTAKQAYKELVQLYVPSKRSRGEYAYDIERLDTDRCYLKQIVHNSKASVPDIFKRGRQDSA